MASEREGPDGSSRVGSWKKRLRLYLEMPTGRSGKVQLTIGCIVLALTLLFVLADERSGLAYYHYECIVVGLMGVSLGSANLLCPGRIALVRLLRLAAALFLLIFLILAIVAVTRSI